MVNGKISKESIALALAVFITTFAATTADVYCANQLQIGELRVKQSYRCVETDGDAGDGNVAAKQCQGRNKLIMCGDGTIRIARFPNYCLTLDDKTLNVESKSCELFPEIPDYQKWRYGDLKLFTDPAGMQQEAREIISEKNGYCLDVSGYNGEGNIGTYSCEKLDDQYFFFRSLGKVLQYGKLQNDQYRDWCLEYRLINFRPGSCSSEANNHFTLYENGELHFKRSDGLDGCVTYDDKRPYGRGYWFYLRYCDYQPRQLWLQPQQYCQEKYCSFVEKDASTWPEIN